MRHTCFLALRRARCGLGEGIVTCRLFIFNYLLDVDAMTMKTTIAIESESTRSVEDGVPEQGDEVLEEVKVAGGSIVDDKPCFSSDSK